MKRFLLKSIVFTTILILYFVGNMMTNYFIYRYQPVKLKDSSIIIIGDSHSLTSIKSEYFNDAQNISERGHPYVLTYWKLKKMFNSNIIPDTLILGFAPHNISQFNDLKFSKDRWSSRMFRDSYPYQQFNDISSIINVDYTMFYKTLWKQTGFYPRKNHIKHTDYNPPNSNIGNIINWESSVKRHYYNNGAQLGISQISVNYLDSIVELTNSNKIKLIIVSNPVYKQYLNNIPISIMEEYDRLIKKYNNNIIFDKTRQIYPDSLFRDADHLNQMGAKRFTIELVQQIKKSSSK